MTEAPGKWLIRLTFLAVIFALVRNLLPPNGFIGTVLLFDYEFGLIRRGLFGQVANLSWGETVSKSEAFFAAAAITLSGVAALVLLCARKLAGTTATMILQLLFFSSFAFAGLVGSTGYLDLLLIALVCLAMLTNAAKFTGLLARVLAAGLGMFLHEVMLPYFTIFLMFDLWVNRENTPVFPRLAVATMPLVAALAAFTVLVLWGQLPDDRLADFLIFLQAKAAFTLSPDAIAVIDRSILDNLQIMVQMRARSDYRAWLIFDGIPLLLMALWLVWLNLKVMAPPQTFWHRALLISAIAAPLSLNLIAFDVVRFGSTSVLVGFLCLISQIHANPQAGNRLAQVLTWPMVVIVLFFNLSVSVNQLNVGDNHQALIPWAILEQVDWLR